MRAGVSVLSANGNGRTAASLDEAPAAIALLGTAGLIQRATTLFLDLYGGDDDRLARVQTEVERIVAGEVSQLTVKLDGVSAEMCAVLARDGRRYALLTVPVEAHDGDGANPLLDKPIGTSPAIVWLKDLDGRYVRVNDRYLERLRVEAEHVLGKTDAELAAGASIEGLRRRANGAGAEEPLELEYTIPSFGDRPAFAVVRFALRDDSGQPVAVCGIAAPLAQAWMARSECARLMRIDRLSRLDELAIREELLEDWELTLVVDPAAEVAVDRLGSVDAGANGNGDGDGGGEHFAALAAELDEALATSARLSQQLAEERRQVLVLREASVLAARRAHQLLETITGEQLRNGELEQSIAQLEARVKESEHEREAERAKAERDASAAGAEIEKGRRAADELQAELKAVRKELTAVRRQLEAVRGELEGVRGELGRERKVVASLQAELDGVRDELNAERKIVASAQAELDGVRGELDAERKAGKTVKAELDGVRGDLDAERKAGKTLKAELDAARHEGERVKQAAAETLDQERASAETAAAASREALERAEAEAEAARAALANLQREAEALRSELAAARKQSSDAHRDAMSDAADELEQLRVRAEQAEASTSKAREEAGAIAAALEAERQAAEELRVKLREARREIKRAQQAAADAPADNAPADSLAEAELVEARAELEHALADAAESTAALEAEQQATKGLRAELKAVSARLERAQRAAATADGAPTSKELDRERTRAERAEKALESQRAAAAQAIASAERAAAEAAAAAEELEGQRHAIEALRDELSESRALIDQLKASAASRPAIEMPEPAPADDRPAGDGPTWGAASQRAVSAELRGVTEWRDTLKRAVEVVGSEGRWDAVVAWAPEPRRNAMKCAALWTGKTLSKLDTRIWQHRRTLLAAERDKPAPTCIGELQAASDTLLKAAAAEGMRTALLVPVRSETETVAVLELLSRSAGSPSEELTVALEALGLQLGAIAQLLNIAASPTWRAGRV